MFAPRKADARTSPRHRFGVSGSAGSEPQPLGTAHRDRAGALGDPLEGTPWIGPIAVSMSAKPWSTDVTVALELVRGSDEARDVARRRLGGRSRRGGPTWTIVPSPMTAMRWASSMASAWSCVT